MKILVLNAGSSSLKYQLIDMNGEQVLAKGVCEKVTIEGSFLTHSKGGEKVKIQHEMPNHQVALQLVLDTLLSDDLGVIKSLDEIGAVGHRVVHGADDFSDSALIDEKTMAMIKNNRELAPLHMPANILCIEACQSLLKVPMVAVFDTAFHQTMPDYAFRYAIPEKDYIALRLRRYGFHGTSHKFVCREAQKAMGKDDIKIITCHLGNGASVSAIKDGKVMDTSMGFTPLEGLMMGTRCGDIDPAVIEVIMKNTGKDIGYVSNVYLNKESGLKGIAGMSDCRDLEIAAGEGNDRAALTLEMLVYQIQKFIGSYTAAMNGLDAVVFTAGIGENNPHLREIICENMEYYGIEINKELNAKTLRQPNIVKLSTDNSKVAVYLIPTNEELVIAKDTEKIVKAL